MASRSMEHAGALCGDPYFKPKQRDCGRCGQQFETTPKRRYFCRDCFVNLARFGVVEFEPARSMR